MTNGDFVSRVMNGLRVLNKDEHVSRRYILKIGQNKSKFYIAQKLLDKTLFRETNLYKTIQCFRLEAIETIKCGIHEFMRCESLMRSRKKIPGLIYSKLGASIASVTSLDSSTVFLPTTLKSYLISKGRKLSKQLNLKYYYIQDNYIYLPDSEVEYVNITYIPIDESELDECNECQNDSKESDDNPCKSIWDYDFIVPDKLSEQVIQETIQEVSMIRQVQEDELPNGDSNQKTNNNV